MPILDLWMIFVRAMMHGRKGVDSVFGGLAQFQIV